MKMVTTKAIAKVAAVATGLAMLSSVTIAASSAQAAGLTDGQIQSILSLLSSFGADSATIANVNSALHGQATGGTTGGTTTGGSCSFSRDLTVGSTGADVTALQNALKAGGYMTNVATGYFGVLTQAGVIAWQKAAGVSPAAGYFGAISRAKFCGSTGGGVVNPPITGNGLKVMLAASSPNGTALVQGQAAADLGEFTFSNPTGSSIMVTNLVFNRIGVSNDSTMTNVYLYNGSIRLTDAAGVSSAAFNFNSSTGLFTVPAGGSITVAVRSDIDSSSSGQQIGVKLVSVASSGTLDASVSFPISGGLQTISAATLATVSFNSTTLPSASTVDPQADYTVWQNTVTVGTRAVLFKAFALKSIGSVQAADITNYRLYVDGVKLGSAVASKDSNDMITFDLSAAPVRLETGGRVIRVVADIVGGASRTFQMSLRYPGDSIFVDTDLGQPVLVQANSTTFSARSATSETINSVSSSAPSISRSADSPTANVSVGATNVKWASFKFIANGEAVKVDNLNVTADTSSSGSGLDNGKVFVNGVQVGSTKDLAEYGATTTNFTFGSSFIVKVGQTAVVDIYADSKTSSSSNLTSGETVKIYLGVGSSNAQGQTSLSSINVPASELTGNQITVSSSALTASKASYYGNQTVIAGASQAKIGAFTLSTGATEGVNVNTIEIAFTNAKSSTLTNLTLKDHDTGAMFGTAKSTVGTTNDFTGSVDIPASGTKTYDVYADIKTGANAGAMNDQSVSTVTTGTGLLTGTSVAVGTAATLQTITVGSANLTVTDNTGSTPDNSLIVAGGTAPIKIGTFRFTTQYSPYTVDKVAVIVPSNGAATSVSNVTVKYLDVNGAAQTATANLALSTGSQPYSTATFTGLSFYVPQDSNRDLEVWVTVPTIASGATTTAAITAGLAKGTGFNAVDSSGTADTSLASSDLLSNDTSGKGSFYAKKSIPTIGGSGVATDLAAGTNQVIGRFSVSADAAGDVDWGQVIFTISKTSAVTTGATSTMALYDVTNGGNTSVAGTFATTTGNLPGGADAFSGLTSGSLHFKPTNAQTVAMGTTRSYEVRSTIGGLASGSNSLSLTIPATTTSFSAPVVFSSAAGTFGTSGNASFVWSDWSDTTHHAASAEGSSTSDWSNDYLVKTLPFTAGSRSVSI